jgi:4-amino-4-deoxy-L-arabinose transferase-like glycosyltransferase
MMKENAEKRHCEETTAAATSVTFIEGKAWVALVAALCLAGLGFRIFGAWCLQCAPNSDYGIVGLMAKHMAEGTDAPVFFYGQPYMGSFEPAISAAFCKLMGVSGFAVCLGTAGLAFFLLPILYAWARDTRDRYAGVATLLYSLIGSFAYFFYCAAPRGGYVSALVFGSLTIWLAGRIAMRAWVGKPTSWATCFLLGLAAGVAWWSNQLVVPFLGAALLTLLAGFKGRVFRPALLLGGSLGFVVGSLPWWWWNATHNWETFEFAGSFGETPFREGLSIFGVVFAELLECKGNPMALTLLLGLVYGAILFAYTQEIRERWRERSVKVIALLTPVFVILLMALVYSTSHFAKANEVRYVLPAFPAAAVIIGVGVARWVRRSRWGWALIVFLVSVQCLFLPHMVRYRKECAPRYAAAGQVADFLKQHDITTAYGGYSVHWMNFASDEALCVTGLDWERYAPYARRAACADKVAYFSDHMNMPEFIAHSGGSATHAQVGGYELWYDAQPPLPNVEALPTQAVRTVIAGPDHLDVR